MKLDYLEEGSDDCPLIRLYEFSSAEIQRLRQSFESLANAKAERIALNEVIPVESVDGTQLTFIRAEHNQGVVPSGSRSFDVILSPQGWGRCMGLLEPFCENSCDYQCYQWLCDDVGQLPLLLSSDGAW